MSAAHLPIPEDIREAVRAIVRQHGEQRATEMLCLSRFSLGRALGGLPMQRGSHALIRERLAALAESPGESAIGVQEAPTM